MLQEKRFMPSIVQCYEYMNAMKLSPSEVKDIEIATHGQANNKLWVALHNGRITSSRFGEIMHGIPSTNPQRLVRDIMGYGNSMGKGQ